MTSIVMAEAQKSRGGSGGETSSYDLIYYVFNDDFSALDELVATNYVGANRPGAYNGFNYLTYKIDVIPPSMYMFTITYGSPSNQVTQGTPALGFQIGGGTEHITTSLTRSVYRDTAIAPSAIDFGGLIGVEYNPAGSGSAARVTGVDVFAPVMEYSLAEEFPNEFVTDAYIDGIYNLCGCINDATFYRKPSGSVLFKGVRGSRKGSDKWEIEFMFAYSPNVSSLVIGGITVSFKRGWDYLDIMYRGNDSSPNVNGLKVMLPAVATVHQVYYLGSFSALGIGSF